MISNKPIGIFDSGLGGISVWKELVKTLPNESVIYYADSLNCPYGSKSQEEIIKLSERIVDFLLEQGAKIIVIACNTATAAAIEYLREIYDIPFVGMEPAVKPAALNSKTKKIAVLATEGTFNGRLYQETSNRFAGKVDVSVLVGEGLVEIVENGLIHDVDSRRYIEKLVSPLLEKDIDHLVLGCTHYPLLNSVLREILPERIDIVDPAPAVARQTENVLKAYNMLKETKDDVEYSFYTSGNKKQLENMVSSLTKEDFTIHQI